MRLKVTAEAGLIIGHKWRLHGEEFEVSDLLGQLFLAQHPGVLSVVAGLAMDALVAKRDTAEPAIQRAIAVTSLPIGTRVLDALDANGIKTVQDLRDAMARGDEAVLALPGIGPRALDELRHVLAEGDEA